MYVRVKCKKKNLYDCAKSLKLRICSVLLMKDKKLRDTRCSTDKECEQRNTAVDKYYTVIGLSSTQIAMSGTIAFLGGVSFFLFVSSPPPREGRTADVETSVRGSEYLSMIIIAACVMYHVVLQAAIVAYIYIRIHMGSLAVLPSPRKRDDDPLADTRDPSLHKSALRPRRTLSTLE